MNENRREPGAERGEAGRKSRESSEQLAREAWGLLFELIHVHMREYPDVVAEFELTPVQAHVLRTIASSASMPMSTLASILSCDASNVTGLVDRMEARGLLERQSAEHDRRVKMLALTQEGEHLHDRLMARLAEPPTFITALSAEDLRTLKELMRRALSMDRT